MSAKIDIEEQPKKIIFKKLHKDSIVPKKGSALAAGYDLFSYTDKEIIIEPLGKARIPTGISVELPHNTYGRVAPRSGLTWNKFLDVGDGVVDEDYRGEILVILFNFSKENVIIKNGDKIAQLIVERIMPTEPVIYEPEQELSQTKSSH
jgi:dUTP pyrophosphatase